jgi:hypothetical protein
VLLPQGLLLLAPRLTHLRRYQMELPPAASGASTHSHPAQQQTLLPRPHLLLHAHCQHLLVWRQPAPQQQQQH